MENLNHYVALYQDMLSQGNIQKAYTGLVKYITSVSTVLSRKLSGKYTVGSIFQGYMDYTYFYYSNDYLKERKLKFGLVLNHSKMQFEVWLLGQTIPVQEKYWQYFKSTKWNNGRTTRPTYSILEVTLIENPNFNDLNRLTAQIEKHLLQVSEQIIKDVAKAESV